MFLVGLTGGVASGKSTVAERFVHHGFELVDADLIAREVVVPGTPAWKQIVDHFGSEVLDEDRFIDRAALGRLVFADPAKRTLLNELTHPPIMAEIADRLELLAAYDGIVVLDVPLLVEAGGERQYDAVVVVAAKPATQVRRLVEHRDLTEVEAQQRVAAQAPLEAKLAVASHVIWNENGVDDLVKRADEVAAELQRIADDQAERSSRDIPNR